MILLTWGAVMFVTFYMANALNIQPPNVHLYKQGDLSNDTVSASTLPDPGYIIIESTYGLSNRLRVLLAYSYVVQVRFGGATIVCIWDVNEACPGHFLSLFDPIPNVIFATNSTKWVFDKHARAIYPDTYSTLQYVMRMHQIPRQRNKMYNNPRWGEIEYMVYSQLFPRKELMFKAIDFVLQHDMCNASAMHIRRTEMSGGWQKTVYNCMMYVQSRPADEPVFLLTDHPSMQTMFIEKYGPQKILIYDWINTSINQLPIQINKPQDISDSIRNHSQGLTPAVQDYRFTTLEQTLIEVLIAAHARDFRPTLHSSLSELVGMLKRIGVADRGWCSSPMYMQHGKGKGL